MIRGSCLCRGIKYQITGPLKNVRNCHCSICRKAHSAAFRSRATVKAEDFNWLQGEYLLNFYETSKGTHRGFCRVCGSPILSRFDNDPLHFGLPLGTLDDDPGVRPQMHIHVANKAPWFMITDGLQQFPEGPQ
jgi:hypothetical protein